MSLDGQIQSVVTAIGTSLKGKQATLVSGTSIKTVNGNSLLGSGDIVVGGSSGLQYSIQTNNSSYTTLKLAFPPESTTIPTGDLILTSPSNNISNPAYVSFGSGYIGIYANNAAVTVQKDDTRINTFKFPYSSTASTASGKVLGAIDNYGTLGWVSAGGTTFPYDIGTHTYACDISIGTSSIATSIAGPGSTALGNLAKASGQSSTSIGGTSIACQYSAVAIGADAKATGYKSIAIGGMAYAQGQNSITIGSNIQQAVKSGNNIVIGTDSQDYGDSDNIILGIDTRVCKTTSNGNIGIGSYNCIDGLKNVVVGTSSNIVQSDALDIGNFNMLISNNATTVCGKETLVISTGGSGLGDVVSCGSIILANTIGNTFNNTTGYNGNCIIHIGGGNNGSICGGTIALNAYELHTNACDSIAIGMSSQATGCNLILLGCNIYATHNNSINIGNGIGSGIESIAIGTCIYNTTVCNSTSIGFRVSSNHTKDSVLIGSNVFADFDDGYGNNSNKLILVGSNLSSSKENAILIGNNLGIKYCSPYKVMIGNGSTSIAGNTPVYVDSDFSIAVKNDDTTVVKQLQILNAAGAGKVLTSDANGVASWQNAAGASDQMVYIQPDAPVLATGKQALWLDIDGDNITFNLVTGD